MNVWNKAFAKISSFQNISNLPFDHNRQDAGELKCVEMKWIALATA
jgi:hypothetical protein